MSESWSITEVFSPILIENYIRFETAAKYIRQQESGTVETPLKAKFKLVPAVWEKLKNCDNQAPLLGLSADYDAVAEILTVTADAYFIELYENKIMRDVALKQSEDCKVRYSKFINFTE